VLVGKTCLAQPCNRPKGSGPLSKSRTTSQQLSCQIEGDSSQEAVLSILEDLDDGSIKSQARCRVLKQAVRQSMHDTECEREAVPGSRMQNFQYC
jgi:hypothetical protein